MRRAELMFSSTAYEAFYQFLGLALHAQFVKIITSQKIFLLLLLLLFGVIFFFTCVRFFSRYMPDTVVAKKTVPLSAFFKITACLFLGISLLKAQSHAPVKKFNQNSWHTNDYIKKKIPGVAADYEVSFIFDLLMRSGEEVSRFLNVVIDSMFKKTNSQLGAPNFFYKAIMLSAAETIEDPKLRSLIRLYQNQCFEKALPFIEQDSKTDLWDRFFRNHQDIDEEFKRYKISGAGGAGTMTCFDLKEKMRTHMVAYYQSKKGIEEKEVGKHASSEILGSKTLANMWISHWLINEQNEKHEGSLGMEKGSELPGVAGTVARYGGRLSKFDGLIHLLGLGELSGVGTAVARAEEFSNDLSRAPHIAGFVKMILIAVFPFLVFFVVAGRWKVLVYWYLIYFSVLLWAPTWTLFYHIMTNIALSADVMSAFGRLHDGVSLYSANLITSRLYKMYSVYSWLQILIGPVPTAFLAYTFAPMLRDKQEERAPEIVEQAKNVGGAAARIL